MHTPKLSVYFHIYLFNLCPLTTLQMSLFNLKKKKKENSGSSSLTKSIEKKSVNETNQIITPLIYYRYQA